MERETIVLLENRNSILPLSKNIGSVALIGPQADRVTVRTAARRRCDTCTDIVFRVAR